MTIAQQVARVNANLETATRAGEFAALARLVALARGNLTDAAQMTRQAPPRVTEILAKAAVNPMGLTTASPLAEYAGTVQAFLESLRNVGAFDRMLPDMKRVPPRTRVSTITLGATGYVVGEGAPKPISSLSLEGRQLAEHKVEAILVLTEELLRGTSAESQALFRRACQRCGGCHGH